MKRAIFIVIAITVVGFAGQNLLLSRVSAQPAKDAKTKSDGHDHGSEDGHDEDEDSEDGHDHKDGESHEEEGDGHDHGEEGEEGHAHGEGEKEEHGEEEGGVIGPDKGITAKSKNGFTLSKEAWASFDLKTQTMDSGASVPKAAVVHIKDGKFYYRIRDGWIKRVPLNSKLQKGDMVITTGTGFVRTAELVVEEGVSHGHSH